MENLKNVLYAGLGLAQQNKEALEEKFNECVKVGKVVDENGKNLINDFVKTLEENSDKLGDTYNKKLDDVLNFIDSLKVKNGEQKKEK
tara:strand:- start:534 stop:797 length:264 start_codon:yes stop_codon:yes gene_type:complete